MCQVIAKMSGAELQVVFDNEELRATPEYKQFNPTGMFPLLETYEGNISESHAIAKFLAHGHPTLMGSNAVERAQVEQWMSWCLSGVQQANYPAMLAIMGLSADVTQTQFNDSVKAIKENLRSLDQGLNGDWLVGSNPTLADVTIAATFTVVFQLVLDQGFLKAAPKACAWWTRVTALPQFVAVFGKVKMAKKALKPVLKSEEKPKKPAAQAAAKPKATEDGEDAPPKKEVNPLDLLPPSPFDLFNFKTFYVNHPDKAGEGFNAFMEQVDR